MHADAHGQPPIKPPQPATWREAIFELSAHERPSASDGERRAAESIAARLHALGCPAVVEQERAHGGYWWPLGLANLAALGGALLVSGQRPGPLRRAAAVLASGVAAAALWDDLGHGRRWFRRALLPRRPTWNVIAQAGDRMTPERMPPRTVVLIAHHDSAHSGLVFHPALGRIPPRFFPRLHQRSSHTLPILYGVWLGPVLVSVGAALGSRRLLRGGAALALATVAAMADIGMSPVVPGANDNLAAVGILLAIAERLRDRPVDGVRVLLLSTGSEESFSEGMQAFGQRHFAELDPHLTEMVCLECLGGPQLFVLEGEGMLRMRDYPEAMRDALADAAAEAGVSISRGLRTVAASDAIIALRAGYPVATLASVDYTKLPLNYHWPSDLPQALYWRTIEDAIALCEQFIRARASSR
ncbi:MAG: M28 family peptidase [Actinobacteria bacterium]|nr:MAG: M28 family peptidase [Actinomycetota bacterium]